MNNILVIAPHPDDETLGCGATIAKKAKEGCAVYVLIATNAHVGMPERYPVEKGKLIRQYLAEAHHMLGVKETFLYDFPAPMLDQHPNCLIAEKFAGLICRLNIDTVYIPSRGDIHIDHKMVYDAAMVACRPTGNCPVKNIFAYETLSETEWAHPIESDVFLPTTFETFSVEEFQIKLDAIKCYKSQVRDFPNPRSVECLEALGKFRGATVNALRAEAFMTLRQIF